MSTNCLPKSREIGCFDMFSHVMLIEKNLVKQADK